MTATPWHGFARAGATRQFAAVIIGLAALGYGAFVLLSPQGAAFMSHGFCYLWKPDLLWSNVAADAIIAGSYGTIAFCLAAIVARNRVDIPMHWMLLAFGTFILACGGTHVMDIVTLWAPVYWLSTYVKVITAIASATTAIALPLMIPQAVETIRGARKAEEYRHAREVALRRYQLLVGRAHDSIMFFRRSDWSLLEANRSTCESYGYSPEELAHLSVHDLLSSDAVDLESRIPKDQVTSILYECTQKRKDGTTFPAVLAVQSAVVDGELIVLTISRDISERRLSEIAVQRALSDAMEASRLKSEFVATMSHEIRTPMNGVIGMTELLLNTPLTAEQLGYAYLLRESGLSLLRLINDVLDLSRIEAGRLEVDVAKFQLLPVVEGVASLLSPAAHEKGLALTTFVDPAIPRTLLGDSGRLRQVLMNLVGNAIKFTEFGSVSVTAKAVGKTDETCVVEVSVEDTGPGIRAQAMPAMFEAFRQGDPSTTRRAGGTGLGLAISKRIVELMGGEISVESKMGIGSTFSFTLSLQCVAIAEGPVDIVSAMRVLVVSDDELSHALVERFLASWNVDHDVCADVETAYVLASSAVERGSAYDVALVDLAKNADAFLTRFGNDDRLSSIRLVRVVPFSSPDQSDRAGGGFSSRLIKPLRQSQVYHALTNATLGSDARSTSAAEATTQVGVRDILVVEDNEINQRLAIAQLSKLGYVADLVATGAEAVDAVAATTYRLVLMDCQMPKMDGFQATRAIRMAEERTGAHVRIVAMTANALAVDRARCLEAGMDDYLAKPVSMNELRHIVERWLQRSNTNGRS